MLTTGGTIERAYSSPKLLYVVVFSKALYVLYEFWANTETFMLKNDNSVFYWCPTLSDFILLLKVKTSHSS